MWTEKQLERPGSWPKGLRVPIIISVHHQSEEACVQFADGQPDPFDYYERQYGGRRGAWRLLEIMIKHDVRGTWIICGATCEKYPEISREVQRIGHPIAGHGYAHESVCDLPPHEEIEVIRRTVQVFEDRLGVALKGWRTCAASHNTIDLLLKHFNFEWDASIWNDDLPYVIEGHGKSFLEIPFSHYTDAANSLQMHGVTQPINPFTTWEWNTPEMAFKILKAQFDALYERGAHRPVLMPLTVHDFITGRPSRSKALDDFIGYAKQFEGVAFTTHDEVRGWWMKNYVDP